MSSIPGFYKYLVHKLRHGKILSSWQSLAKANLSRKKRLRVKLSAKSVWNSFKDKMITAKTTSVYKKRTALVKKCLLKNHLLSEKGKRWNDYFPPLPRSIRTEVVRRSPPLSDSFSLKIFFHHFRFCFWDLLKTNLKEKVIIFKSLQEFFSPARNWLWFFIERNGESWLSIIFNEIVLCFAFMAK